ncbi:MAG: TMAO reductase system sensor histidine kinase/response regulator TorS [Alphaproteobacteria bacterium]|nr:TMAO reductase system sensor histidine kinase/response regulator TorS [Alphaproteobacteria bacterium]
MLSKLGLGARLFIAFLGITALSLSSGVAGWRILREISAAQSRINSEALPGVAAAQRTAEASARLVAAAPALSAVRDEPARASQERELLALAAEIRDAASQSGMALLGSESLATLSGTVDALVSNLAVQNRLVKERLQLQRGFAERAERIIAAATAIVDLSETLVSNASAGASAVVSNLYSLIDDPARHGEAYDALDRLIEQDIYLLDRMWELRLRSSQIALLANRLTRASDRGEVAEIAIGFENHLRVVGRRVASIDDPVRRQQAGAYLQTLESAAGNAPVAASLFGNRMRLLAIGDELEQVAEDNRRLSAEVSQVAQDVLRNSEDFARATSAQAERAVNVGLYVLVITSLVAVAISGLIVWLYVERGVVRRLEALANAMQRLTAGDLAVEVTHEGTRELKALSEAVVAFRDETQTRRSLEIERERTNEELRRHREELQELVDERTAQLQREVESHAAAREKAEMASRAKSDFLATMSHEIRTPMTGMLGMLRIVKNSALPPSQRRQLTTASNSGEALLGILNSILDYSKIESGKLGSDDVDFSVRELLRGVVDLMRAPAREKGLKLSLTIDRKLAPRHRGDAGKLRQIVFNLVSNAIKFTPKGNIKVVAAVLVGDAGRQSIRISVTDTGIGIPAEERDHIFESFTQTDASITRRYGGTGLGLAISRGLAQSLGGTITVESAVGAGSCFTLNAGFPVAAARSRRSRKRKEESGSGRRRLRVLVVEDDEATRAVASRFLADMGHEVTTAADGFAALAEAERRHPDLVVMDISLPGMDGIATAQRLRADGLGLSTPIIAMSAHVFKDEVDHYLGSGMDGYVAKPLTPETLEAAIAKAGGRGAAPGSGQVDRAVLEADIGLLGRAEVGRILGIVEETLPRHFSAMGGALQRQDAVTLARLAHAAFSAASAAGFMPLGHALKVLEESARQGQFEDAARQIRDCEALFRAAMSEARAIASAD